MIETHINGTITTEQALDLQKHISIHHIQKNCVIPLLYGREIE